MRSSHPLAGTVVAVLALIGSPVLAATPSNRGPAGSSIRTRRQMVAATLGAVASAAVVGPGAVALARAARKGPTSTQEDGFSPEVARRLDALLRAGQEGTAALDADGTLWGRDVSYGFVTWALRHGHLDQARADALARDMKAMDAGELGDDEMIPRLASGFAGLSAARARLLAERYFDEEHRPLIFAPMAKLVGRLHAAKITPWIVSGSADFLVRAGARHLGIPPEHVIGVAVEIEDGILTDRLVEPVPWKAGKAAQIRRRMGAQPPLLVAGNGSGDLWMLRMASGVALVINPGPELLREALSKSWPIERFPDE